MNYIALSREISYALRHAPQKYGLIFDDLGWVAVEELITALNKQEEYRSLTIQDIADMIQSSEKKRHEINGNRIRALYGHSTKEKISKKPVQPPNVLYHGTTHKFLHKILKQGLISKNRQYVHLSQEQETATTVGRRRDDNPVVLSIDALAAWKDGVKFYHGNEMIWLADSIPANYISTN